MIRRPPRSTLLTHSFPTRRSSDLAVDAQDFVDFFGTDIVPDTDAVHSANDFEDLAQTLIDTLVSDAVAVGNLRSEEHTSELQSLMRISYAVFCLKKKTNSTATNITTLTIINSIKIASYKTA